MPTLTKIQEEILYYVLKVIKKLMLINFIPFTQQMV